MTESKKIKGGEVRGRINAGSGVMGHHREWGRQKTKVAGSVKNTVLKSPEKPGNKSLTLESEGGTMGNTTLGLCLFFVCVGLVPATGWSKRL